MINILTLSDRNYIINGLCLYDSLVKYTGDNFTLYYLAMDSFTEDKLRELELPNLVVYTLEDIEKDPNFKILKKNNESRPINTSDGQSPFHWMLASFFCHFLMLRLSLEHVLYADSDIFFYDSAERITEAVEGKSIGVITHKHIQLNKTVRNPGYFNVGVVYFRNDSIGKSCLRFWRDCCIHPNNQFSDIFGSCGDQKYLELFEEFFDPDSIQILCHKVGNGAPWNFTMFDFSSLTRVVWRDPLHYVLKDSDTLEQDIVFNHFSHFSPNYNENSFSMDRGGEWGPGIRSHPGVEEIYVDYMHHMTETKKKYVL